MEFPQLRLHDSYSSSKNFSPKVTTCTFDPPPPFFAPTTHPHPERTRGGERERETCTDQTKHEFQILAKSPHFSTISLRSDFKPTQMTGRWIWSYQYNITTHKTHVRTSPKNLTQIPTPAQTRTWRRYQHLHKHFQATATTTDRNLKSLFRKASTLNNFFPWKGGQTRQRSPNLPNLPIPGSRHAGRREKERERERAEA